FPAILGYKGGGAHRPSQPQLSALRGMTARSIAAVAGQSQRDTSSDRGNSHDPACRAPFAVRPPVVRAAASARGSFPKPQARLGPSRAPSKSSSGVSGENKAAGEVMPPSNPLTGPAAPERSVCAPGRWPWTRAWLHQEIQDAVVAL